MPKTKTTGLIGVATLIMTGWALGGSDVRAAGGCIATNEEELYTALADETCGGVITLNASEIEDKGIQITKDFDGAGATLMVGTSSYGLLVDDYGLDGHAGVPAGASITIKNVTIKAAATTKALININDIPVRLENVTTDRTATGGLAAPSYFAHIDVKNTRSLSLVNYSAIDGVIAIDYSQEVMNNLKLTMDAASMSALGDIPVFMLTYGRGVISVGDAETLAFLTDGDTVIVEDDVALDAKSKSELILTTPVVLAGATEDGRDVVVVEDGAEDAAVAGIAEDNDDFKGFLAQVGDDAVFLALDDRGDCDGSGCRVTVTVSNLESATTYYLYHYDDEGNVELVGEFLTDEDGYVDVSLEKFSGNVLSKVKVGQAGAEVLVPATGVMGFGGAGAEVSLGLMVVLGVALSVMAVGVSRVVLRRMR